MTLKRVNSELINEAKKSVNMKNLKGLINEHDYTITKVAMNVGINDSTLYEYLKNNALPSLPVLINLANFFQCNIDYLIGRTNNPALYDNYKPNEVNNIIHFIETLTKEEKEFVSALLKEISKRKEKINN